MKKKNKAVVYGIIILLLFVAIGFSFFLQRTEDDNVYACSIDSDCTAVKDGCCGCTAGGANTAINRDYLDEWSKEPENECKDVLCIQVISNDPSCFAEVRCVQGKCKLV